MQGADIRARERVHWLSVVVYYLLACAISWPFFWKRDILGQQVPSFAYMWGPGIAAIITLLLFRKRHPRTITLFGSSIGKSLLFYLPPSLGLGVALALSGGDALNEFGSPMFAVLLLPIIGLVNILGEELGWRGFLQDALRPISPVWRYTIIGVLWEFWHFTNRTAGRPLEQVAVVLAISYIAVIVLSWIIGVATDRTKSIMVAVTLHAWVNALFEFQIPGTYIVFALSLPLWFYLLKGWDARTPTDTSKRDAEETSSEDVLKPIADGVQ